MELTAFEKVQNLRTGTVNGENTTVQMYDAFDDFRGFHCYLDYHPDEDKILYVVRINEGGLL